MHTLWKNTNNTQSNENPSVLIRVLKSYSSLIHNQFSILQRREKTWYLDFNAKNYFTKIEFSSFNANLISIRE